MFAPTDFDGVADARFDAAFGPAVLAGAENDPEDRRAKGRRHPDAQRQMFLRGAPIFLERARGGANAPGTKMDLQTLIGRLGLQIPQIRVRKIRERFQVGDEKRIGFQRYGIVDELLRLPAHGPDREVVQTQLDLRLGVSAGGGWRRGGQARGQSHPGDGERFDKLAAGHAGINLFELHNCNLPSRLVLPLPTGEGRGEGVRLHSKAMWSKSRSIYRPSLNSVVGNAPSSYRRRVKGKPVWRGGGRLVQSSRPWPSSPLKNVASRSSRGNEAQISSEAEAI